MPHGSDVAGKRLPFGCGVLCKPTVTKCQLDKANAGAQHGIFLGYRLAQGCRWRGEHLVADVDDFAKLDLDEIADAHQIAIYEHVTKVVALPKEGYVFPLKKKYDMANHTPEKGLSTGNMSHVTYLI